MKRYFVFTVCGLLLAMASFGQPLTIENNQLKLNGPVPFKTGTDQLAAGADSVLQRVKQLLNDKTYITTLRVEGHLAAGNNENASQALSEKRALTVCQWLVANGVDCKRLLAVGFGSSKPAFSNATAEERAQNNRVVFAIAALRGRLIGGMPADGGGKVAGACCQ